MPQQLPRLHSNGWLWIAAIWSAFALFDASQSVFMLLSEKRVSAWSPMFVTELASWLPWMLATPLIIRAARRDLPRGPASLRAAAQHVAVFTVLTLVAAAWVALLHMLLNPWRHAQRPGPFLVLWRTTAIDQVVAFLIVYALIVTIALVVASRESIARQATEAARLDQQLARAQLTALRRQMEPHFLFNTLNSITALIRDHRNDDAVQMIVAFSDFLRRDSEDAHSAQVTLGEEVEYLHRYLDIQRFRFGSQLNASVDVPPEIQRARVPSLLLQPLVENAIKHGIARRSGGGLIRVTGERCNGRLQLTVYNDGPSEMGDGQTIASGIGLENLRTRLGILHPGQSELHLHSTDSGGVEVLVTLPFVES
jgi:two-component system, LytTR family, sensor kinase